MNKILSKIFNVLKYLLLVGAFAVVLVGVILTYKRLEKDMIESIPIFIPFVLLLILFVVNIFIKGDSIKDNLFFNLTAVLVLAITIVIGLRAKFDTNMIIYYRYKIDYNPLYFADNLSTIKLMLYMLSGSNILLIIASIFDKPEKIEQPVNEIQMPIAEEVKIKTVIEQPIVEEQIVIEPIKPIVVEEEPIMPVIENNQEVDLL